MQMAVQEGWTGEWVCVLRMYEMVDSGGRTGQMGTWLELETGLVVGIDPLKPHVVGRPGQLLVLLQGIKLEVGT